MYECDKCEWYNPWKDSGDRGAAKAEHDLINHPNHEHVWGDSPYHWDKEGVQRCTVCQVRPDEVQ